MPYREWLEPGETRVAVVHSGKWTDPISCRLDHIRVEPAPERSYIALSYVWGSRTAVERIRLNGQGHNIGVNLACAIRHLRDEEHDVVIWIDAVCVNQENLYERSIQVAMMRGIYSSAKRVVVFLGDGAYYRIPKDFARNYSSAGVTFWNDARDDVLLEPFRHEWRALCKSRARFSFCTICLIRILSDLDRYRGMMESIAEGSDASKQDIFELLRSLINSRWWHRIWVVQEITVPPEVMIQYGNVKAPWQMFESAADACDRLGWGPDQDAAESFLGIEREYAKVLPRFSRQVLDIKRLRLRWKESKGADLLSLLQEFSGRLATDERDKVFALLGLARDNKLIRPDYSLDTAEVYRQTIIGLVRDGGSLAALAGDLRRKNSQNLPSWIPDWSAVFEEPDYRRMALQKTYSACSQWRMKFVDSEHEYWEHVAQGMQDLLDALKPRKHKLPVETRGALCSYREYIHAMLHTGSGKDGTSVEAQMLSVESCLEVYQRVELHNAEAYNYRNTPAMSFWLQLPIREFIRLHDCLPYTTILGEKLRKEVIRVCSKIYLKLFIRTIWGKVRDKLLPKNVFWPSEVSEMEYTYTHFLKNYGWFPSSPPGEDSGVAQEVSEMVATKVVKDAAEQGIEVTEHAAGVVVKEVAAEMAEREELFCFREADLQTLLKLMLQVGNILQPWLSDLVATREALSRIVKFCDELDKLNNGRHNTPVTKISDIAGNPVIFGDPVAWMRCLRDPGMIRWLPGQSHHNHSYLDVRRERIKSFSNKTEILATESRLMATVEWCGTRLVTWIDRASRLLSISQWVVQAQLSGILKGGLDRQPLSFVRTLVGDIHEELPTGFRRLCPQDYGPLRNWFVDSLLPTLSAVDPAVDEASWATALNPTLLSDIWGLPFGEGTKSFDKEMRLVTEGRVFFITKDQRMGLGPSSMAAHDDVHMLPNGETPFILRSRSKVDGYFEPAFEVIGDCFLNMGYENLADGLKGGLPREILGGLFSKDFTLQIREVLSGYEENCPPDLCEKVTIVKSGSLEELLHGIE
ncbi:heterokaryon incompatibility (het-6OR allele) [Fusarium albosuccineum]|uniref:Heterokaryon incompatibility (Het-6OR allele) n=1 Tax=Fusarium albosuccineum TaxID=1237068 RepID=A0A8H4LMQ8_9HYPO|nr:heterokaryon incompatibility (het-6OR allele) [Fusarium albosuccineum]